MRFFGSPGMDAEYRKLDSRRTGGGDVRGFTAVWSARDTGANDFRTAWLSRHTLRESQMHKKSAIAAKQTAPKWHAQPAGIAMIWSTHLRCAAAALFAMAVSYAVSAWAIPSARAFTMESLSTGGNTTRFAEPDGPANNFGRGAQPFGPGGPMVQFGARQGQRRLSVVLQAPVITQYLLSRMLAPSATAIKPACGSARIAQRKRKNRAGARVHQFRG